MLGHRIAIHPGQADVEQDQIRWELAGLLERFGAVARLQHAVAHGLQPACVGFAQVVRVFDHQYTLHAHNSPRRGRVGATEALSLV